MVTILKMRCFSCLLQLSLGKLLFGFHALEISNRSCKLSKCQHRCRWFCAEIVRYGLCNPKMRCSQNINLVTTVGRHGKKSRYYSRVPSLLNVKRCNVLFLLLVPSLPVPQRLQQSFYGCFPCLRRGWPTALHSSLKHLAPCHPGPSPSFLTFHLKQQFFSPIHHHPSAAHVPTILIYSISQHQTLTQLALYPSAMQHTILISIHSNLPLCSAVMSHTACPSV